MQFIAYEPNQTPYCPFCGQAVRDVTLVTHYREYFSQAYEAVKERASDLRIELDSLFGAQLRADLEQHLRITAERLQFWSQFLPVDIVDIDLGPILAESDIALTGLRDRLEEKLGAPLEPISISESTRLAVAAYDEHLATFVDRNSQLAILNEEIDKLKANTESANTTDLENTLATLEATKRRYSSNVSALCDKYAATAQEKSQTEARRDEYRRKLDDHRQSAFPQYEKAVNASLERFGAGFRIAALSPQNLRSGSTSNLHSRSRRRQS